jgi:hypothetical protein
MSLERQNAEASVSVLTHLKSQPLGLEGQLKGAEVRRRPRNSGLLELSISVNVGFEPKLRRELTEQ